MKHQEGCLLSDADETDQAVMLVNLGPCPCPDEPEPK